MGTARIKRTAIISWKIRRNRRVRSFFSFFWILCLKSCLNSLTPVLFLAIPIRLEDMPHISEGVKCLLIMLINVWISTKQFKYSNRWMLSVWDVEMSNISIIMLLSTIVDIKKESNCTDRFKYKLVILFCFLDSVALTINVKGILFLISI